VKAERLGLGGSDAAIGDDGITNPDSSNLKISDIKCGSIDE